MKNMAANTVSTPPLRTTAIIRFRVGSYPMGIEADALREIHKDQNPPAKNPPASGAAANAQTTANSKTAAAKKHASKKASKKTPAKGSTGTTTTPGGTGGSPVSK